MCFLFCASSRLAHSEELADPPAVRDSFRESSSQCLEGISLAGFLADCDSSRMNRISKDSTDIGLDRIRGTLGGKGEGDALGSESFLF